MKIRTDFVTNSSSSSFVATLTVKFENGYGLQSEMNWGNGDDSYFSMDRCIGYVATEPVSTEEPDEEYLDEEYLDEESDEEYWEDGGYDANFQNYIGTINLSEIVGEKELNNVLDRIGNPFGICVFSPNDKESEESFAFRSVFKQNAKSIDDIDTIAVDFWFDDPNDEFAPEWKEIYGCFVGEDRAAEVEEAVFGNGDLFSVLRSIESLSLYGDQDIKILEELFVGLPEGEYFNGVWIRQIYNHEGVHLYVSKKRPEKINYAKDNKTFKNVPIMMAKYWDDYYAEIGNIEFEGKTFVSTGIDFYENEKFEEIVESRNGIVKNSVTKLTDYLVYEEGADSSKMRKARMLIEGGQQIKLICINDFLEVVKRMDKTIK